MRIDVVYVIFLIMMVAVEGLTTGLEPQTDLHRRRSRPEAVLSSYFWKPKKFSYIEMTDDMKQQFVHAHNKARSSVKPHAANMVAVEWDDRIAEMSQDFVSKCKFAHSPGDFREMTGYDYPLGENLFVGMSLSKSHTKPHFIVKMWNDERKYYDFKAASCARGKMCGHYTQVVWATSHKIGCAIGRCPSIDVRNSTENKYDILVACHYGPNGNWRGEQPYKPGRPCSACPFYTHSCIDKLCT